MNLEEKLEFFQLLLRSDFKEIEVGFPAASETEYTFLRTLIEQDIIPDDVTIQVLTQSREHIIQKTYESLKGAKNAVVHFTILLPLHNVSRYLEDQKKKLLISLLQGRNC